MDRRTYHYNSVGWDLNVAMQPYGDKWREHRRIVHQQFHIGSLEKYHAVLSEESRKLLRRLLSSPEKFIEHTKQSVFLLFTFPHLLILLGLLLQPCGFYHIQSHIRLRDERRERPMDCYSRRSTEDFGQSWDCWFILGYVKLTFILTNALMCFRS